MSKPSNGLLLALSLALNIFVVGAAAGAGSMWYWSQSPMSTGAQRGLWLAADDLPREQQQAFRKLLGDARRGVKTETAAGRASRDELERLLVQEPLDRAAIDTELAKIRSADAVLRVRLEEAVVSFAGSLSVGERKLLVDGLKERGRILRRVPAGKN